MKTQMEIFLNAISNAGFEGVELRRDKTFAYLKNHTVEDLKRNLVDNNLECITFNAIELFSLCPIKEFEGILDYTEKLMIIGNQIGCDTVITVPSFLDDLIFSNSKIISKTVERLNKLIHLAENYNFKLGFEPLGFVNCSVRKIDMALKVIEVFGLSQKIGLIIDTFHYFVGNHSIKDLDSIPLDKLWLIHINDAIKKPFNELEDSDRVLPSQGFFNLEGFIKKLKEIGYNGWVSLELFNEKLWGENPFIGASNFMRSLNELF